jgi:hypothetical protein
LLHNRETSAVCHAQLHKIWHIFLQIHLNYFKMSNKRHMGHINHLSIVGTCLYIFLIMMHLLPFYDTNQSPVWMIFINMKLHFLRKILCKF